MLLPELVSVRSWARSALRAWSSPTWQLVQGGTWHPRAQPIEATRAQIERTLACSVVVVRRRHGALFGPLLGLRAAASLKHLVLVEACSLAPESPWDGEHLEPVLRVGLEACAELLVRSYPEWSLRAPEALQIR